MLNSVIVYVNKSCFCIGYTRHPRVHPYCTLPYRTVPYPTLPYQYLRRSVSGVKFRLGVEPVGVVAVTVEFFVDDLELLPVDVLHDHHPLFVHLPGVWRSV